MAEPNLSASNLEFSFDTPLVVSQVDGQTDGGNETPDVSDAVPRRRILHVINGEHYSGSERVQDLLAVRLPEFGYEVGFALVKPGRFPDSRHYQASPVYDASMRSRFDLSVVKRLVRVVKQEDYRLIHAHTPRSAMIGRLLAWKTGLPMIYHVHSPTERDSTHLFKNRVNGLIESLSVKGIERLIAVSQSLGQHMRSKGFSADKIAVVPNGVGCLEPVPPHAAPSDEWTLGTVALFRPRKGTEYLLRAIAILAEHNVPVRLHAVGGFETTEYEQRLKRLANELRIADRVNWTGFTSDVTSELAKMDLFVLPSIFGEGLPMVVLEAMACGIPVIGTNVEGVPEAVRDGLDGVIAEPRDEQSLANAISDVIDGHYNWTELRQNCIERQSERFSDRSMARGVAEVYDSILGAPASEATRTQKKRQLQEA